MGNFFFQITCTDKSFIINPADIPKKRNVSFDFILTLNRYNEIPRQLKSLIHLWKIMAYGKSDRYFPSDTTHSCNSDKTSSTLRKTRKLATTKKYVINIRFNNTSKVQSTGPKHVSFGKS